MLLNKKTYTFGRYRAFSHERGNLFIIHISMHLAQSHFTLLKYKENLPVLILVKANLKCILKNNEGFYCHFSVRFTLFRIREILLQIRILLFSSITYKNKFFQVFLLINFLKIHLNHSSKMKSRK